jgi:hypothetical protein
MNTKQTEREPFEEYTLPSHWASSLINGDDSGQSDEDIEEIYNFLQREKLGYCAGVSEESYFQHGHDANRKQGAEVSTFIFRTLEP